MRNPPLDTKPAKKILQEVAEDNGLPWPTHEIDSGSEGIVFETTDPTQVCRVGTRERVFKLMEWQHSGAVVQVFYIEKMQAEIEGDGTTRVVVSWQEKIDDHVEGFIYRKYKGDKETQDRILGALTGLYDLHWGGRKKLKILAEYDETIHLAEAIEAGMPTNDLSLESNLGVTADGRIVAFDL